MLALTELREYLGISQQFLASYLLVHRSQLNMAEMNQRNLPGEALQKLVPMISCMHAKPVTPAILPQNSASETTAPNKDLLYEATNCDVEAHKLTQQLKEMQYRYQQALQAKAMADYLAVNGKTTDASLTKDAEWIMLLKNKAETGLQNCSLAAQALLQWRLEWYAYGAKRAREMTKGK